MTLPSRDAGADGSITVPSQHSLSGGTGSRFGACGYGGTAPGTRSPGRSGCAVDLSRHDEAAIEGRASFRPVVVDVEGDRDGDGFAGPQRHLPAFRVEL